LQINDEVTQTTTVAILVSNLSKKEVNYCRELASKLQAQQVRLILIAHGNQVDSSLLAQVTGDSDLVLEWAADAKEPADQETWLQKLLDCPAAQKIQVE
jgi:uncharacterized protein YbcI